MHFLSALLLFCVLLCHTSFLYNLVTVGLVFDILVETCSIDTEVLKELLHPVKLKLHRKASKFCCDIFFVKYIQELEF